MLRSTRRALIGAIASTPIVVTLASQAKATPARVDTSEWDQRLNEYLTARDAYEADLKGGSLRTAYNAHDAGTAPPGQFSEAEERHHQKFGLPREGALQRLLATPVPSLAALRQKIWIAESEFVSEDTIANGKNILAVIGEDIARIMMPA
jgi:hypothetical protein